MRLARTLFEALPNTLMGLPQAPKRVNAHPHLLEAHATLHWRIDALLTGPAVGSEAGAVAQPKAGRRKSLWHNGWACPETTAWIGRWLGRR
ncbi:MAG: hypothetical protein WDN69_06810 [Aliidongia sp.]